ncbi:MAG: acyl-CoA/acyl-ACP dehydrogenase [Gammaproteobacteria bacterium]|nr:acyl-CoA/acyl-ACP dehydrogenase [Gammaproteobacteria bacterium]
MDVLLDEDETLLQQALRRFFESRCPPSRVRAAEDQSLQIDSELWSALAELGWLGLALPAMHGGSEAPLSQLGLLFEEAGRALAPVPLLAHTVAALCLARHATPEQQERLLPAAIMGDAVLTWSWSEQRFGLHPSSIQLRAERQGNGWRLTGSKRFVDAFPSSTACIVPARTTPGETQHGISLLLVSPDTPGLSCTASGTLAGDRQYELHFDGAQVGGDALLGEVDKAWPIALDMLDTAVMLNTAMTVGATRMAVERAVAYAKERHAFGKPIAAFQAIQHMCANMITWVDGAELLNREAIWKRARGEAARLEIAGAKAFANEYCQAALREANQIHGGVAQVREYDQQLWYRRAAAWTMRLGTSLDHRRTVADELALGV